MRDGQAVLVGMVSEMRVLGIQYGAEVNQYATDLPPTIATLSPDGQTLFVATDGGSQDEDSPRECDIIVFDVASGQVVQRLGLDDTPIRELGCPITSHRRKPGRTYHDGWGRSLASVFWH